MNTQQPTTPPRPQFEAEKTNGSNQERFRSAEYGTSNSAEQAARIGEALEQLKKASTSIYDALASFGVASGDIAKLKLNEGKRIAWDLEHKAENKVAEKPLLYVGAAFALGWLLSRVSR
ncbi:hypothetical protein [Saccharophagus sp. K07]|jgi:hypothetical protein|uniref:hypothetical protein n=1 Tax=Saccharophagus sp. K07 TaxID=2283636 RepID=UPI001CA30EAB|nr:hypothetical protein [Saccharophagus sp. K07]